MRSWLRVGKITKNSPWIERDYAAFLKSFGDILLGVGEGTRLFI